MINNQYTKDIAEAVKVMRAGGVILYPTDTVWGIGCDATNAEAVAKIYAIKKRAESKAMICLVDSDNRIQRYVRNVPEVAWDVMTMSEKPTTVILDGEKPHSRRWFDSNAHYARTFLERTLLQNAEAYCLDKCQHQRRASSTKLLRHIRRDKECCRLYLHLSSSGASATQTIVNNPHKTEWRI